MRWRMLDLAVFADDGGRLLLLGHPPDAAAGPEVHDCAAMGCGLDHVLVAIHLAEIQRQALAGVATIATSRPPSLRAPAVGVPDA